MLPLIVFSVNILMIYVHRGTWEIQRWPIWSTEIRWTASSRNITPQFPTDWLQPRRILLMEYMLMRVAF